MTRHEKRQEKYKKLAQTRKNLFFADFNLLTPLKDQEKDKKLVQIKDVAIKSIDQYKLDRVIKNYLLEKEIKQINKKNLSIGSNKHHSIWKGLINKQKKYKGVYWEDLVGCTIEDLTLHLEYRRMVKFNRHMSTAIGQSLKKRKGAKNGRHWEDLVGYTIEDLTLHLEKQFEPWMNWDNFGRSYKLHTKWSLDHIVPLSAFNFTSTNDEEFKLAWGLDNLQPLDTYLNLFVKRGRLDYYIEFPIQKAQE